MIAVLMFGAFLLFAFTGLAQEAPEEDKAPRVQMITEQAGPIEFHVIPEFGAGVLLRDDQTITLDMSGFFLLVRIPGLRFPGWNETTTGLQVELSDAPGRMIRYDIMSYTRTQIAGPAYTGANVRFLLGVTEIAAEFRVRVMPVIGIKLLTIAEHIPFSLEVEFFDSNRPFKAAIVISWE